jgi:hypothetical protein
MILAASSARPWDAPASWVVLSWRSAGVVAGPIHAFRTVPLCSPVKMRCMGAKTCLLQRNSRISNVK